MKLGPASHMSYVAPKAGRPLKLIVNASRSLHYDQLRIAEHGIRKALSVRPEEFNVLELMDMGDSVGNSYTGLNEKNIANESLNGYILTPEVLNGCKKCFKNVTEFILMGGAMGRSFDLALLSLVVLKIWPSFGDLRIILKGNQLSQNWVTTSKEVIAPFNLKKKQSLDIHIILSAVYPALGVLRYRDPHRLGSAQKRFPDWESIPEMEPNYKEGLREFLKNELPFRNYQMFLDSGLNIFAFMDGKPMKEQISKGNDLSPRINFHYWNDPDQLPSFSASRAKKGKA